MAQSGSNYTGFLYAASEASSIILPGEKDLKYE